MDLYPEPNDDRQPDPVVLEAKLDELGAALGLVWEALAKIKSLPPPALRGKALREAGRAYLATVSNKVLRKDLIAARGAQAATVFATKLNGDLAALGKLRPVMQGRDLVARRTNGNGHTHNSNGVSL